MNDKNGWISLHRSIQNHWLWEEKPFSKGQAWIDLIMLANYEDKKMPYKGEIITCKRGTVNLSISFLAERWGWGREKTREFLKLLESDKMVTVNATKHRTTITIENYRAYQNTDLKQRGSKQYGLGYHNGKKDAEKEMEGLKSEIPSEKIMLTIKEASEYSGLSYNAIRQMCLQDKIPYIRAGNKYLINKEKLIEYLKNGDK